MTEFNSLEIVQLITTQNVKFMSGPAGQKPDPNYYWSIVGFVGDDVILAKESTIIRVPTTDIRRVGTYSVDHLMNRLADVNKTNYIDAIEHVSQELKISPTRVKSIMRKYHIAEKTTTKEHLERIVERISEILEATGGM
jgi:hypothetical protein